MYSQSEYVPSISLPITNSLGKHFPAYYEIGTKSVAPTALSAPFGAPLPLERQGLVPIY